jgi:hypothetical protein
MTIPVIKELIFPLVQPMHLRVAHVRRFLITIRKAYNMERNNENPNEINKKNTASSPNPPFVLVIRSMKKLVENIKMV